MGKSDKKKEEKKSRKKSSSSQKESKKHSKKEKKSHRKEGKKKKSSIRDTDSSKAQHHHEEISNDDYFNKNEEFRLWLKLYKNISFESINSEDAHRHFNDFVKSYNKGKLPDMYYVGIPADVKNG
jgi:hypothetical protein